MATSRCDPSNLEVVIGLKCYAKGIGVVEERQIFGGTELVKLTKVTPAP